MSNTGFGVVNSEEMREKKDHTNSFKIVYGKISPIAKSGK